MKKILLLCTLFSIIGLRAQTLMSRNYNGLTVGNIGTNIAGSATGEGGMITEYTNGVAPTTSNNAAATNGQIVANDAVHSNVLQFVGPNGDKGGRFIWENGLPALWSSRAATSNIIEIEVELYTSTGAINSKNLVGLSLYGNSFDIIPVGFRFNPNTLEFSGQAYYATDQLDGATYGTYNITLGTAEAPNFLLPANTWVKIGISYNTVTREIIWKTSTGLNAFLEGVQERKVAADNTVTFSPISPLEIDYFISNGSTAAIPNTAAATVLFDNLNVKASSTDTLLGLGSNIISNKFVISPNPTSDFVTISNSDNINNVSISDLNGRIVKESKFINVSSIQINLASLVPGMYMMSITSEKGTETMKVMKN